MSPMLIIGYKNLSLKMGMGIFFFGSFGSMWYLRYLCRICTKSVLVYSNYLRRYRDCRPLILKHSLVEIDKENIFQWNVVVILIWMEWNGHSNLDGMESSFHSGQNGMTPFHSSQIGVSSPGWYFPLDEYCV